MRALLSAIAAGILALCCAPAAFADAVPEYFNLPPAANATSGLATAPDGTVWFGADPASRRPAVGRLIPSQAAAGTANGVALFPTPVPGGTGCCANFVRGLAFDGANNRLWFVQSDAIVGFADAARVVPDTSAGMVDRLLVTPLSGGGTFHGGLQDVAIGAGGLAWFTEANGANVAPFPGDRIASIDANLTVTESDNLALQGGLVALDPLRYEARPAGIATDASGKPWFAESDAGNPGWRIATSRGLGYDEYLIEPCAPRPASTCSGSNVGIGASDVAVAHDGSVWFTNQLRNEVGRLDVAARTFTNYSLTGIDPRLAGGQPRAISVAPDGTLWVAQYGGFGLDNANAIVKIVPSQPDPTAAVFHLGAGKFPLAVAPDTKGNVWFTLATNVTPGQIGRLAGVVGAVPDRGGPAPAPAPVPAPGRVIRAASVGVARIGTPSISADGRSIRANQVCVGPPRDICSLVYLISSKEYVAGFPGSRASAARRHRKPAKPKPVILGRKLVTLHGGQSKLVTISLNATGRRLLARARGGRLTAYFTATQAGERGKPAKRVKQAKVTFTLPHRLPRRRR